MVYIQSNSERTLAHHFDCACALYGAVDSSLSYRLTTFDEVASGKFDLLIKNNLFVGSVEFMKEVFKRVNIFDIRLPANSDRECIFMNLGEALKMSSEGNKLFIKPIDTKLFSGLILDGTINSCLFGLSDDTKIMAYDVFSDKIMTEWRFYISDNVVVDARNYSGDFLIMPDVTKFKIPENFPCAYTIDIGVLENGEHVVIEYNDMWSIGNYGMPNDLYLRLLKKRYFEIIKS